MIMEHSPSPTPLSLADCRKMVERAAYCVENDLDNEALRLLSRVCKKLCEAKSDEEADVYMDAISVLSELRQTDNEYVWEQTGPLIRDYLDWLDSRE